jgi:Cys-tRNA synthase (O-phospho-L-seryl-tRNA:Cys-tRNA synthase)
MLYNLIEKKRGKETVVMTDSLPKVNDRMKTLRASLRTKKVSFRVEKTEETDKYKKKPHNYNIGGGDAKTPRKVKWGSVSF